MLTIDHYAFPHILDQIYEFADYDALMALRRTARQYRDRSDARLAEHLVVHAQRITEIDGLPALQPSRIKIVAPGGQRLPFFYSWDEGCRDRPENWQKFSQYFAHTTTVDMVDEDLSSIRCYCLSTVCPKLRTLRMLNNYESGRAPGDEPEAADTHQQSATHFPGPPDGTFVQFSYAAKELDASGRPYGSRAFFINPIPRRVRRCVVNLSGDLRDGYLSMLVNTVLPPELKELVLVFHPEQGPTPEDDDGPTGLVSGGQRLADIVLLLALNIRKVKIVIVGALGEQESECRFIGKFSAEEIKSNLVDIVETLPSAIMPRREPLPRPVIRNARKAARDVQWLSVRAYKKSLKPMQWETECVPRPWHSPAELYWRSDPSESKYDPQPWQIPGQFYWRGDSQDSD